MITLKWKQFCHVSGADCVCVNVTLSVTAMKCAFERNAQLNKRSSNMTIVRDNPVCVYAGNGFINAVLTIHTSTTPCSPLRKANIRPYGDSLGFHFFPITWKKDINAELMMENFLSCGSSESADNLWKSDNRKCRFEKSSAKVRLWHGAQEIQCAHNLCEWQPSICSTFSYSQDEIYGTFSVIKKQ